MFFAINAERAGDRTKKAPPASLLNTNSIEQLKAAVMSMYCITLLPAEQPRMSPVKPEGKTVKTVLEILKNTTTASNENGWFENNGEEGALSLEGIANTLAVEAVIQAIVKGAPYIGKKFAKSFLV